MQRNPYPAHYQPAFACSLIPYPPPPGLALRFAFPAGHPAGETTGLPRSVAVTVWVRSRLSAGGASTTPEEFGASGPDHVPFWSKRVSILRLAYVTTVNSASPELTIPHNPGSQPPCDAGSRGIDLAISATLRERGGYIVPGAAHPTIPRDARPGRIPRAVPRVMLLQVHDSNRDDFVSHPNAQVHLLRRLVRR